MGRPMRLLLASILVFHAGWYLVLPFFALLFTAQRHLRAGDVGMLLAMQAVALLLGSLLGAVLTDSVGRRLTMAGGLLVRAAGLLGLGFGTTLPTLIGAAFVTGIGGGLFAPSAKAAVAVLAPDRSQSAAFSWRSVAATIGTAVGPLLGALLIGSLPALFTFSALLHAGLAIPVMLIPDTGKVEARRPKERFRDVLSNGRFFVFILNVGWMWALFAQLGLALPLYAGRVLGLGRSIGLLFALSSLALILLQVPVIRFVTGRLQPMTIMALGTVAMGLGFGLVAFATGFFGLLGAMLVVVLGQMLVVPTSDSVVSASAEPESLGAYFGVATLAWGLGEAFGVYGGGLVMEYSLNTGVLWLPWLLSAAAGVLLGGFFFASQFFARLHARQPRQTEFEHPAPQDGIRVGPGEQE